MSRTAILPVAVASTRSASSRLVDVIMRLFSVLLIALRAAALVHYPPLPLLVDGSNLQLGWSAAGRLSCDDCPGFHDLLGEFVDRTKQPVSVLFDGGAFHGDFAGERFESDSGLSVVFTPIDDAGRWQSADDVLTATARSLADDGSVETEEMIAREAELLFADTIERCAAATCPADDLPIISTIRVSSVAGKKHRDKVEAFFKSAGVDRLGQPVHMLSYTARQRERSLALCRGLRRLGGPRGSPCTFERLRGATSLVASNDRRLRLRCANAGSILLSKQQLYSWLSNLDEGLEEEEEEE